MNNKKEKFKQETESFVKNYPEPSRQSIQKPLNFLATSILPEKMPDNEESFSLQLLSAYNSLDPKEKDEELMANLIVFAQLTDDVSLFEKIAQDDPDILFSSYVKKATYGLLLMVLKNPNIIPGIIKTEESIAYKIIERLIQEGSENNDSSFDNYTTSIASLVKNNGFIKSLESNGDQILNKAMQIRFLNLAREIILAIGDNNILSFNEKKGFFSTKDKFGNTFLHTFLSRAFISEHDLTTFFSKEIMRALKLFSENKEECLIDFNIYNSDTGRALVHIAAAEGNLETLKILAKFKTVDFNIHTSGPKGKTPLHLVLDRLNKDKTKEMRDIKEMARFLVETVNVNCNISLEGHLPISTAIQSGNNDLAMLIFKKMGEEALTESHSREILNSCLERIYLCSSQGNITEEQILKITKETKELLKLFVDNGLYFGEAKESTLDYFPKLYFKKVEEITLDYFSSFNRELSQAANEEFKSFIKDIIETIIHNDFECNAHALGYIIEKCDNMPEEYLHTILKNPSISIALLDTSPKKTGPPLIDLARKKGGSIKKCFDKIYDELKKNDEKIELNESRQAGESAYEFLDEKDKRNVNDRAEEFINGQIEFAEYLSSLDFLYCDTLVAESPTVEKKEPTKDKINEEQTQLAKSLAEHHITGTKIIEKLMGKLKNVSKPHFERLDGQKASTKRALLNLESRVKALGNKKPFPDFQLEFTEEEREKIALMKKMLELTISDTIIKAYAISKGLATPNAGSVEILCKAFNAVGAAVPLPYVYTITNGLTGAMLAVNKARKKQRHRNIMIATVGKDQVSASDMAIIINCLADVLVYRYAAILPYIHPEHADRFCRCLTGRMVDVIHNFNRLDLKKMAINFVVGGIAGAAAAASKDNQISSDLTELSTYDADAIKMAISSAGTISGQLTADAKEIRIENIIGAQIASDLDGKGGILTNDKGDKINLFQFIVTLMSTGKDKFHGLGSMSSTSNHNITIVNDENTIDVLVSDICKHAQIVRNSPQRIENPQKALQPLEVHFTETNKLKKAKERVQQESQDRNDYSPFGYLYTMPTSLQSTDSTTREGLEIIEPIRRLPGNYIHPTIPTELEAQQSLLLLRVKTADILEQQAYIKTLQIRNDDISKSKKKTDSPTSVAHQSYSNSNSSDGYGRSYTMPLNSRFDQLLEENKKLKEEIKKLKNIDKNKSLPTSSGEQTPVSPTAAPIPSKRESSSKTLPPTSK